MTWEALGAIGEIVGAIAVVATLAYLAVQIKQNREDVQSANFHRISDSFNDLNRQVAGDPELARILNAGFEDYKSLSEVEKTQFGMISLTAARVYDSLYYQVQRGTGDSELWESELETLKWFCSRPGYRDWWAENQFQVSKSFKLLINELMRVNPPNKAMESDT